MSEPGKGAPPPQAVLGQMINGYWLSWSIVAAARLGLADAVSYTHLTLPTILLV